VRRTRTMETMVKTISMKETLKAIGVFVPSFMSWDAVANAMRMLGQIASEPQPQGPQVPLNLKPQNKARCTPSLQLRCTYPKAALRCCTICIS